MGRAWKTSKGRRPGGILLRCPDHLDWLLLTQRSSVSAPSSLRTSELLTQSVRLSPGNPRRKLIYLHGSAFIVLPSNFFFPLLWMILHNNRICSYTLCFFRTIATRFRSSSSDFRSVIFETTHTCCTLENMTCMINLSRVVESLGLQKHHWEPLAWWDSIPPLSSINDASRYSTEQNRTFHREMGWRVDSAGRVIIY